MDYLGLIAGIVLIAAVAVVIGIKIYKQKKETGVTISFDEFIAVYGNQIVQVLIDVIQILKYDHGNYEDKSEYEYTVISITIDKLKENSTELGIDNDIIKMVGTEALTNIVQKVLHNEVMEIFNNSIESVNIGNESIESKDMIEENTLENTDNDATSSSIENELPYEDTTTSDSEESI